MNPIYKVTAAVPEKRCNTASETRSIISASTMHQSSASAHEVNTMEAKLAQVSVLLLGVVVAVLVGPCSSVTQEPMNNREPSSHTQTSSELLQSVMVNQMTLLRILNQSSTNCSPGEFSLILW